MRKITYLISAILFIVQTSYSQDRYSRITINNADHSTVHLLAGQGIDLRCGAIHENGTLTIEVSEAVKNAIGQLGISYQTKIEDLTTFYGERAERELPRAIIEARRQDALTIAQRNTADMQRGSVASSTLDNYLQYNELNEKDWAKPLNFELGSMGGCYTISEVLSELDDMRTYSVSNGLNIVSVKQDASPSNQTTWGNPSSTITNNGLTYSGQGTSNWGPQTIFYVRITGNESATPEGTKPQILFTSMIHSREVNALMGNMYFMWYLIENYNSDPAIQNLVDNNELYFVPVVNPDGLRWNEHLDQFISGSGAGMQRKNLRPGAGGTGNTSSNRGVDLNRNFDYFWGSAGDPSGSSGNSNSDSYRGPTAASEPETQIMVDFILNRNFQTCLWNHSFANSIPHPYGGNPGFVSGREDEMHQWHEDMTKYNRYVSGATIFSAANGIADDWMVGGNADTNGSVGSGQNILATTPEHGSSSESSSGNGFWPNPSNIIPIAKRSMRISLMNAYYGGKYAKLHDLTQSDITSFNSSLDFGIERLGQAASNYTLTFTPVSSNITNIVSPSPQTGMTILEQRTVSAALTLNPGIQPNEKIEFTVTLSNDEGAFYEATIEKYYQPTVILFSDPQAGFTDWTNSGWNRPNAGGYTGSRVFRTGNTVPYANNTTKTITTANTYDLSNSDEVLVQFYAKWDLERNYDFVELQASTNGTTWVNLNGKYTKPSSTSSTNGHNGKTNGSSANFQNNNSSGHLYDGDRMDKWVMEEIVIDASNNSSIFGATNVSFRFRMRSDADNDADFDASGYYEQYSTNYEGFFIDDFKIIGLTIPCATSMPTGLAVGSITATEATPSWDNIPSATYDIRYKETTGFTWTEVTDIATASYAITGLTPSTDYEVQVRSRCTSATSAYSASVNFTTTDITYCGAGGSNINDEYIGAVSLNGVTNDTSGSTTSGYSDFTGSDIFEPIQIGSVDNSIAVTKFWNTVYDEAVSVWIDFNKNGFFDSSEKILTVGANRTPTVSGLFDVPSSAITGSTTMRVLMKYYGSAGTEQDDPCESFQWGEVEDYSVYLYDGLLYTNSTWYPNPPSPSTGSENALILDGTFNASSDFTVNNLSVNGGATLNLDKTNAITVNGNVSNDGEFVLNSDSNEFSSLIVNGSVSGDVVYHRQVNSNTNGNDLISPPVSGEAFTDFLTNNSNIYANGTQTLFLFGDFPKPINEYQLYSNTESTTLAAGMGYRAASTDNGTFMFEGAVTTSTLNYSIEKVGTSFAKWNLIGNPYPSYIRLADFLTENISQLDSQSAAVYGYDADDSNGSIWTIWNLAFSDANPGTLIAPGQGFFVSSKDGGATISFTPSMRTAGNSDDFIAGRNASNTIEHAVIEINNSNEIFGTDLYLTNNATLGLDLGYDAEYFGGAPSDYSIFTQLVENNQGLDMAVQSLAFTDIDSDPVIPLGVNLAEGQQATIGLGNSDINTDIYLEDTQNNSFTLLSTSDYTFTADANVSGIGRFYLRFSSNALSVDDTIFDHISIYADDNEQIVVKGQLNYKTDLTLYDIQGREILNTQLDINSSTNTVNTSGFMKGVYMVKLSNANSSITEKVIIR